MPRALSCTIQSTGGHFSQSILLSLAEHMKPMGSRHHRQVTAIEAGTHPQASGHSPAGSPSLGKRGLDPMVDPTDTLHVQQDTARFFILRAGAPAVQKGCRKRSSRPAGCCSKAQLAAPEPLGMWGLEPCNAWHVRRGLNRRSLQENPLLETTQSFSL